MAEAEKKNTSDVIFKINQRLDIMLTKSYAEQYSSRIEDIGTEHMVIAMPMSKGFPILLRPGNKFYGKILLAEAVYLFTSTFLDKRMQPLPIWIISKPEDVQKIQQRAFVRVDATLPVQVEILPENEQDPAQQLEVATRDISGGGLKIICKQPMLANTKLLLTINVPEAGLIQTAAEVMRVERPQPDRELYWVGVKFVDMNEQIRSKIIRFVFKRQMEQRKKGI